MSENKRCPDCGCELPETDVRLVYLDWVKEVEIEHTPERCKQYQTGERKVT